MLFGYVILKRMQRLVARKQTGNDGRIPNVAESAGHDSRPGSVRLFQPMIQ